MNSIVPLTNQVLLFAGATNTANMSQWEAVVTVSLFFQPLHPHTINPTASTHRHFVLISFAHIKRPTEDDCPLNSTMSNYDLTENRGL